MSRVSGQPAPSGTRGLVLLALVGFLVVGSVFANIALGFPGPWDPDRFQTYPDAVADWLVTRAAFDGFDPYRPVDDLAAEYAVPIGPLPDEAVHPRFPGAFLLQAPLLLVSWESVVAWMGAVNLLSLAASAWWVSRTWPEARLVALLMPFLVLTPLFLELMAHGGHVGVLVLLLTGTAVAIDRASGRWAGVTSAVLGTLRGFPLMLIPALARMRLWRPALVGSLAFLTINVAGLMILGLSPQSVVAGLRSGSSLFGTDVHNASLAGMLARLGVPFQAAAPIGLVAVLAVWAVALRRPSSHRQVVLVTVPAMLLASPLCWPSYALMLIPWFGLALADRRRPAASVVIIVAALGFTAWALAGVAVSGVVGFLIAVVAFVAASVTDRGARSVPAQASAR